MNRSGPPNPFAWKPPVAEGPRRTLLLVEDDPATLRLYLAGLKGLVGWELVPAANGREALDYLEHHDVDVVVTDIHMPVMDGYRLLTLIYERYPAIPVAVLTSLPEGEPQDKAKRLGALRVLSKPVRLSLLMEEVLSMADRPAPGFVRGLALGSLLQLMAWDKKTCTLTVRSGERVGRVYVQEGRVIHAEAEGEAGLPAAYRILCWERPVVTFVEACRVACTIELPVEEILLNTALILDGREGETRVMDAWGAWSPQDLHPGKGEGKP